MKNAILRLSALLTAVCLLAGIPLAYAADGYDYAYTYPGMNGILQAAGRVIRRDTDRGVVVLVDDRYATEKYRALMPPHWEGIKFIPDVQSLQAQLKEFWKK